MAGPSLRRAARVLAGLMTGLAGLAACTVAWTSGSAEAHPADSGPATATTAATTTTTAVATGTTTGAPVALELPRLDGQAFVKLTDFAGKPVLINFWGSECPPCVAEMPRLFAAASRQGGLQFLGVAVDQRAAAQRFLAQREPTYLQLIATTQPEVLLRRLGNRAGALPYTVVVDPAHRLCASHLGEVDDAWIEAAAQACGGAGR